MFVLEKAGGTLNGFAELGNFGLAHFEILNFTARLYLAAMADVGKLLAELIALPSVNPAFVPEGTPGTGEQLVADYLTALGGKVGLAIELQEVFPGRHNVIARLEPRGKRKQRVLLGPHMDTVVAAPEQFRPVKRQGKMYGRGACDTKGSVAAMLTAVLEVAKKRGAAHETEIVFCAFVDEEDGQNGSRRLARTGFKADLAIVGEPTKLKAVTAHKGDLWLKIETHGKAAHGSKPYLGKNAVLAMCPIVEWLENDYAAKLRRQKHWLLGSPTISVGAIRGGTQANVVPDRCEIIIDRRTIPGERESAVVGELKRFLKTQEHARLVNYKQNPCLPMETNLNLPLVREFMGQIGQTEAEGVDFFCDSAVLSAAGIPCVVFGPGDIAQAHTSDEWISLTQLERATTILEKFLLSLP
jgi:acetylornithine deacetylase/succinyl-diaminopimelate desuccinylase-like protein